jgi:hypothetical protein
MEDTDEQAAEATKTPTRAQMAGFDAAVGASPFKIAPERDVELLNGIFGGTAWELEFNTSLEPKRGTFIARPVSKIVEVNYAALASIHLVAKAAWLIARAGMSANRSGEAALPTEPGSAVSDARRLAEAARTVIANSGAQWPTDLAPPVPDAEAGDEEWYVNNVFLGVTGWITLHEIGHIHHRHQGTVSTDVSFAQEHEADLFAASWVLSKLPPDDARGHFRVFVICVAMFWLAILDGVRRGSTTHPHAWQRLERLTSAFPREELNPGYEMAAYVLKVMFLAERDIPVADHPEAAFFDLLFEANRLPR